jgi:hypothetical protein
MFLHRGVGSLTTPTGVVRRGQKQHSGRSRLLLESDAR